MGRVRDEVTSRFQTKKQAMQQKAAEKGPEFTARVKAGLTEQARSALAARPLGKVVLSDRKPGIPTKLTQFGREKAEAKIE